MTMRIAAIGAVLLAVTACADQPNDWATEPSQTELEAVEDECDGEEGDPGWAFVYTADDGRTLIVDTEGEEDLVGATIEQLACVLFELDVPSSIAARMGNTRALDGVQTGTWDSYTVTWSYHPNSGLDLIVEEN